MAEDVGGRPPEPVDPDRTGTIELKSGPGSLPGSEASQTAVVETHISTLFFVGDRVFKLRKPVRVRVPRLPLTEQPSGRL